MSTTYREGKPGWWDAANTRAMLVCRISDRKQKDGVSLDAQQHLQERYARDAGLSVAAVASFQESAKKSTLRSQFHAAIAKARAERVKHLVFYVWDRIARNFTGRVPRAVEKEMAHSSA
jgi:DNA invertase Pin-like site-specific DNA recombinase